MSDGAKKVDQRIGAFLDRMRSAGMPEGAGEDFARMYSVWLSGGGCTVAWEEVAPPHSGDITDYEELVAQRYGREAPLDRLAWIVLNGGIGTSMRMSRAKSLVHVKNSESFLDLLGKFVKTWRAANNARLPVCFMDSYATRADTLAALAPYDLAVEGLPLDFEQHRFPRVRAVDGMPFGDGEDQDSWAPPGHGDIYLALRITGLLDQLIDKGYRWLFVSNADNLGAAPDPALLGFMAARGMEFMLEVTPKTAADVKGGVLARIRDRLSLLEIAQVPADKVDDFQDTSSFPAFNTNNAWIDLRAVKSALDDGGLKLPVIVNKKVVGSEEVIQLEHAMGAGLVAFSRTCGVLVGRNRFAPVKTNDDLLVRRSNCYVEGNEAPLVPNPEREKGLGVPWVQLDKSFYGSVDDLDLRAPFPLDLMEAESLVVKGDVRFGSGVKIKGRVTLENSGSEPLLIPDGEVLEGRP